MLRFVSNAQNITLMSKGKGHVQRTILEALAYMGHADSLTVAYLVFGDNPVLPAQAASVRRALRRLVEAGEITDLGRGWSDGRRRYGVDGRHPTSDLKSDRRVAWHAQTTVSCARRFRELKARRPDLWAKVLDEELEPRAARKQMKAEAT